MVEQAEQSVVIIANTIQIALDVVKEADGNAFTIPEDRKQNDQLIAQDISKAIYKRFKQDSGVSA